MTTHRISDFVPPAPGDLATVSVEGRDIAVTVEDGQAYAFDDTCTHMQCSLASGEVEDGVVVCPCHAAGFDIRTGAVVDGPALTPLRSYAASLAGDCLEISVPQ